MGGGCVNCHVKHIKCHIFQWTNSLRANPLAGSLEQVKNMKDFI